MPWWLRWSGLMQTSTAPVWNANTLIEALALRSEHPEATVIAGGTDLMVFIEGGQFNPTEVLNIWSCDELRGISVGPNGASESVHSTPGRMFAMLHRLPDVLRECACTVGAEQIQNRATVGGNIVNASPAGDSLPVVGAQCHVRSRQRSRNANHSNR